MTPWLFVYGSLKPGESRWRSLQPLLTPHVAVDAVVPGLLYDTQYGYPAAVLSASSDTLVPGVVVELDEPAIALNLVDEIEGTGAGLFSRQLVAASGRACWAYTWPHRVGPDFVRIPSWPCSRPLRGQPR